MIVEQSELLGFDILGRSPKKKKKSIPVLQRAISSERYYKENPNKINPDKPKGMFDYTEEDKRNERNKFYSGVQTNTPSDVIVKRIPKKEFELSNTDKRISREQREEYLKQNSTIPYWTTPQGLINKGIDEAGNIIEDIKDKVSDTVKDVTEWYKNIEWYWWLIIGAAAVLALYLVIKVV